MASDITFDHWKVVFSWGKVRKSGFSQNPLNPRFWALGFLIYILSSANFNKKNPPWQIQKVTVHVPATSVAYIQLTRLSAFSFPFSLSGEIFSTCKYILPSPSCPSDQFFLLQNCPLSVLFPHFLFLLMALESNVHGRKSFLGLH